METQFWEQLKEQRLAFFDGPDTLWRVSLPHNTAPLDVPGKQLVDWGGAQRWLKSSAPPEVIYAAAQQAGGHATCCFPSDSPFQPLPPVLLRYHRQLKAQLDPHGIFNPGRMYADI